MLRCDQSSAHEGEGCASFGQRSCAADRRAALICLELTASWTREATCSGPRGCAHVDAGVDCDDSQAHVGELCARAEQRACTPDGSALLRCVDGRFALERSCAACTQIDAGLQCD